MSGWFSRCPSSYGCSLWKGICKGLEDFEKLISFKVNNGKRV